MVRLALVVRLALSSSHLALAPFLAMLVMYPVAQPHERANLILLGALLPSFAQVIPLSVSLLLRIFVSCFAYARCLLAVVGACLMPLFVSYDMSCQLVGC